MAQNTQNYKYIPVKAQTKTDLDELGKKGQTYDQILKILIQKWNEKD